MAIKANVVLGNLDLNFQRTTIETLVFRIRWELAYKCMLWLLYHRRHHFGCCSLLNDLVLNFHGQICFFVIHFAIQIVHWQCMFPADLPLLTRIPPWTCSCYVLLRPVSAIQRSNSNRVSEFYLWNIHALRNGCTLWLIIVLRFR